MRLFFLFCIAFFCSSTFAQISSFSDFHNQANNFFSEIVSKNSIDYTAAKGRSELSELRDFIANANTSDLTANELKAFRINAYNLSVISLVLENYPLASVQEVGGFFEKKFLEIEGELQSLNQYEKKSIIAEFDDARLHFVLVCGAKGCPPIVNFAYAAEKLEEQLMKQTSLTMNNPDFLRVNDDNAGLSQIFKWYAADFGSSKSSIIEFINTYKSVKLKPNAKINYYEYDWNLNDTRVVISEQGASSNRYVVSAAIPKGGFEYKIFNNLYSQTQGVSPTGNRSTFFTAALSGLYGLSNTFNIGLAARYRFVKNEGLPSSPVSVFSFNASPTNRYGLTAIGPQIRYAPFRGLKNFSIQSSFTFPIGKQLAGNGSDKTYIDWNGAVFNTQFFNDFTLSGRFSLFTEIDFLLEDIGFTVSDHSFRASTPVTVIASFFPNPKSTAYLLSGFSPYWQKEFDYFYQFGAGTKYQLSSAFEVELLFSYFNNKFLAANDGQAFTYNIGIRYSVF